MGIIAVLLLIFAMMTTLVIVVYFDDPFEPPVFTSDIDITGREEFNADSLIHDCISNNLEEFAKSVKRHQKEVDKWIQKQQQFLEHANFKKKKEKQYQEALKMAKSYIFVFSKGGTHFYKINNLYNSKVVSQDIYVKSLTYEQLVEMCPIITRINHHA